MKALCDRLPGTSDEKKKQLEKQIATLKSKMQREKQLNRQMEMNAKLKKLRIELKQMT